jgi:molecular chaperone DnaJ
MDLYSVLGVSRTATSAEIDRAFRRLARRYHPGVNPGDRVSEAMYAQIAEAHAVLMDAARRREYDRGTTNGGAVLESSITFEGFDFTAAAEGPRAATFSELFSDVFRQAAEEAAAPSRGADLEQDIQISFRDAARGAEMALSVTRQERCAACRGHGHVTRPPVMCPSCGGAGSRRWARGHLVFTKDCEPCAGRGRIEVDRCRACGGVGTTGRTEVVSLTIPAGIEDGDRIAVPGRGHAGARGGPAGDLYVTVRVAPHAFWRRQGRDLFLTVPVAVHEAALGARIEVPTLDGRTRLRIPPGTASGQRLRLKGQGIGAPGGTRAADAGDLVIEIQIVLPASLDAASRALLEEFGRRNTEDVRRHLFT